MEIKFCGAARNVTGSAHLLTLDNGYRILLDCGLYQGRGRHVWDHNNSFEFDPMTVNAMILSHSHIDHCGRIPQLVKAGFSGNIICTHATRSLCGIMLLDSAKIQERDVEWHNKKLLRKKNKGGKTPRVPLYTSEDVQPAMNQFLGCSYGRWVHVEDGVEVFFADAGHILGSASVVLRITENGTTKMFGFTGDIGRPDRPILRDPAPMKEVDYLICESTYGDKEHEDKPAQSDKFLEVIKKTCIENKGKLVIPAFSVGRTQEIVYLLDQMYTKGILPKLPVYVDSPLAVNATIVFGSHPECFDDQVHEYMLIDDNPFGFNDLTYVKDVTTSKWLNESTEPCIIISSSGMMNAGRVKHHLFHGIENPKNTFLIVGYCSPDTPGGMLKNGIDKLKLYGEWKQVRANVEVMESFSAHADRKEILGFIDNQKKSVKKIFLVHGEIDRQSKFKQYLMANGFPDIEIPELGQSFELYQEKFRYLTIRTVNLFVIDLMHYKTLILLLLLVLAGCSFPSVQDIELSGTYAIPLINDKIAIQDYLGGSEQYDFISDSEGRITLRYSTELLSEGINDLLPSIPSIGEIEIVDTISTFPLSTTGNFNITKAIFKGDEIRFRYSHDKDEVLMIHMMIPELTKNGEVFEFDYTLDPKGALPFTEFTQSFSLEGYQFLSEDNLLTFHYDARSPAGERLILPFAAMSFNRIVFEYGEGGLERTEYNLDGEAIDLNIFDAWKSGKVEFENPSITFEIRHSFGFPMSVFINEVVLRSIANERKSLEGAILSQEIALESTEIGDAYPAPNTILSIDTANSNISTLFNEKVDQVTYDLAVIVNPSGELTEKGFVTDSSSFSLLAHLDIPLSQKIDELSLSDTIAIDDLFPEQVSEAEFKVVAENTYPVDLALDLVFLDENNQVLERLFGYEPLHIEPSQEKTRFINIDPTLLVKLKQASKLVIEPVFDSSKISEDFVQLYAEQFLDLRVGLKFKL